MRQPVAPLSDHDVRQLLVGHPLLRDADPERLGGLLDQVAVAHVTKGTVLNAPGADHGMLHLVLRGRLRAYQVTADGRELLLELIPAGGFDGMLSSSGRRGHFTEANTDATVASLDLPALERLIAAEPKVVANLLGMMLDRIEAREDHLEVVVLHDPDRQLARQLMALADTLGSSDGDLVVLDPRITHQMLADMLGVRRETVTLHLARLAENGGVTTERGRLKLDLAALEKVVNGRRRRDGG